ncbi:hypothetical protein [Micromonospora sp. NPDC005979]|uniref:hypothetical protein n=1 Tax=Micromonospora sp. NPDC005979 TaxID=3156726 RepID=UPI00339E2DCF
MKVLLRHGPADGRLFDGGGETVVVDVCVYERSGERANRGEDVAVSEHRADYCEANQRAQSTGASDPIYDEAAYPLAGRLSRYG